MAKRPVTSKASTASRPAKKIVFGEDGEVEDVQQGEPVEQTVEDEEPPNEDDEASDSGDEPEVVGVAVGREQAAKEASRAER
jgi:hypothetical protein